MASPIRGQENLDAQRAAQLMGGRHEEEKNTTGNELLQTMDPVCSSCTFWRKECLRKDCSFGSRLRRPACPHELLVGFDCWFGMMSLGLRWLRRSKSLRAPHAAKQRKTARMLARWPQLATP